MADIPDEAVEAALTVIIEADPWGKVDDEAIRAALEAALPHLPCTVEHTILADRERIKELEDGIRQHRDAEKSPTEYGEQADDDLYALLPDDDRYLPSEG